MSISTVYEKIGEASVRDALADCREFQRLEEVGYQCVQYARGIIRSYAAGGPVTTVPSLDHLAALDLASMLLLLRPSILDRCLIPVRSPHAVLVAVTL